LMSRSRACANNLRNVTAEFPLGTFTAGHGVMDRASPVSSTTFCTRCSLTNSTVPGRLLGSTRVTGPRQLRDKVVHVDQAPIGRTPRDRTGQCTPVYLTRSAPVQ
jgi:excinuclease ABC subunit A